MFDKQQPSPPEATPPTPAEVGADTLLLAALTTAARAENQNAYLKVHAATNFHRRWSERRTGLPERLAAAWSHAAYAELAAYLACSPTTATHHVELGRALRERLPKTRAAFASGNIDYTKARRLATATAGFSPDTTATVETAALALSERYAPAGFATAVEDLLIRTAPDEYAELRKDATERQRRIRQRNLGTIGRIEADLAPHEAAAVWQRLTEVAATVCAHDPRDTRHRLVDAYLALMHGENHLACTCHRDDCTADPTPPTRRTPLVQITIDAATLLGLRAEPAYLPGHGPIDPALARELATDATWQGVLTELVELAVTAGIFTPEQTTTTPSESFITPADLAAAAKADIDAEATSAPEPVADVVSDADVAPNTDAAPQTDAAPETDAVPQTNPMPQTNLVPETDAAPETDTVPQADPVPETDAAPETDPASQTDPGPSTPNTDSPIESDLHTRLSHPLLARFVARGTRRRAGYLPSCVAKPVLVPIGDAYLYDQFLKLLAAHPELVDGKHPDGHGGYDEPPPGALTYKPSAETAALVRARDRHCRFPGCQMPAARCQLDHIVPFDHAHPARGGWSTASDLECVCEFHHALKTAGLWHAVALPGMAILWTGPRGDRHLTLPAGGLTPVPAADLHSAGP